MFALTRTHVRVDLLCDLHGIQNKIRTPPNSISLTRSDIQQVSICSVQALEWKTNASEKKKT